MKHTIFFLLTLALCWGCISDREPDARSKVTVELTVRPDPMTTTTRTTDEAAIRDLNFYLIDRKGAVVLYRYLTATTLRFECLPGDYLVRIAANVGRSLGETADLFQYKVTYQEHYNMLPMFCEQKTTISLSSDGVVQLPPITVKRVVSKISYNLTAKPADMELKSVQLISIPRNAVVVGTAKIQGERLDIGITSLEYDGTIIPVELAVYDTDGQPGIFIPNSMEMNAVREVAANMGGSLGSSINISTNAGAQLASDLGKGLIQGTSQYIAKKMRTVKVHLKAGYKVMLYQDRN